MTGWFKITAYWAEKNVENSAQRIYKGCNERLRLYKISTKYVPARAVE